MSIEDEMDILIIDEDQAVLFELKTFFTSKGYSVITASLFSRGLEYIILHNPKVVITEIIKNGSQEGIEVLRTLRRIKSGSVFIILTNKTQTDPSYIKSLGLIFEYIKKPAPLIHLLETIQKAIQFNKELTESFHSLTKDETFLKDQLEWLLWKEQRNANSKNLFGKVIIETIVHSIFQGMGVGGIVSLIELIEMSKKDEGDYTKIKTKQLNSLIKNVEPIKVIKEKLDNVVRIFDLQFEKEMIDGNGMNRIIHESVLSVEPLRIIKDHKIKIAPIEIKSKVVGNADLLSMAIRELLTNAFKYSSEKTELHISCFKHDDGVSFIIMNSILPVQNGITGIPPELEYEIFEPFFKINHNYDERFYREEIGFGIGLSVIKHSITKIGGDIHLREIMDHVTSATPTKKILAELILPYHK
jgi:signal transduction histidine kinase